MPADTKKMELKLAVVDLAGTLVDFGSRAPAQAFVELFSRHGISLSEADARGPMGMQKRDHIAKILELPNVAEQWISKKGASTTSEDIDALYREFIIIQMDILPQFSELLPGALDSIQELRQMGIIVAGTTGYNRAMADVVLESMAAQGLSLDCFCCAEDVHSGRPAPWMIYRTMEMTGIFPPNLVVNAGDTIPDILSGRNAGVWSVGVTDTGNMTGLGVEAWAVLSNENRSAYRIAGAAAMNAAGAHFVLNSIGELPELIRRINARLNAGERP